MVHDQVLFLLAVSRSFIRLEMRSVAIIHFKFNFTNLSLLTLLFFYLIIHLEFIILRLIIQIIFLEKAIIFILVELLVVL